jgi:hypothetical protein
MRLASLQEFRSLIYTPSSAPALNTLRARIKAGRIAGGKIEAGRYYVDLDEYDRANNLRDGVDNKLKRLSANPVLQGLT